MDLVKNTDMNSLSFDSVTRTPSSDKLTTTNASTSSSVAFSVSSPDSAAPGFIRGWLWGGSPTKSAEKLPTSKPDTEPQLHSSRSAESGLDSIGKTQKTQQTQQQPNTSSGYGLFSSFFGGGR